MTIDGPDRYDPRFQLERLFVEQVSKVRLKQDWRTVINFSLELCRKIGNQTDTMMVVVVNIFCLMQGKDFSLAISVLFERCNDVMSSANDVILSFNSA